MTPKVQLGQWAPVKAYSGFVRIRTRLPFLKHFTTIHQNLFNKRVIYKNYTASAPKLCSAQHARSHMVVPVGTMH